MAPFTAPPFHPTDFATPADGRDHSPLEAVAAWCVAVGSALALVVALGILLTGGRFFVVETPSMGQAASVGTLVVVRPVDIGTLRVGDVVTFREPTNPAVVYTHRVVRFEPDGSFRTRGDINGAIDPWPLRPDDVIGAPVALIPVLGWICKAAPILLVGGLLVWLLTDRFRDPVTRRSLRIAGSCLVVSYAAFVLRALVDVVMIGNAVDGGSVHATVVSTGILPTRVHAQGGDSVRLLDGQVGELHIPQVAGDGIYRLTATTDLSWWGWVLVGVICLVPLVWCLRIGRRTEERS
ncbi:signal peptidase I [uncultured Microbacterium sp.]|uniref:signal peptidase I n=1 Tax=uncultured Microbacterium sp. TaxID=191216 RepID=UPI0025FA2197|nr:signal peptidase I [uncultured Microbacterium sp.]